MERLHFLRYVVLDFFRSRSQFATLHKGITASYIIGNYISDRDSWLFLHRIVLNNRFEFDLKLLFVDF